MNPFILSGLVCAICGCLGLYLASPKQQWRARPLHGKPVRWLALALLAGSLALFWQPMQAVAAVFTWLTAMMLLLAILPYLSAFAAARRSTR